MDLYSAIREAVKLQGEEVIKEERFVNILSDLHCFASNSSLKHIFKVLYASDCMNKIYSIWKSKDKTDNTELRFEIQKTTSYISTKYAIKSDYVCFCLENIYYALYLIPEITTLWEDSSFANPDLIGLWDFHYKESKEMSLEIKRDGTASASSGTKYKWQYSNDIFVLYIEDFVYYKGSIENNIIKGVAYSIYKPLGWAWFATKRNDGLTIDNLESGTWVIINDVPDLEDNHLRFLPKNILESSIYGVGRWTLENEKLEIVTANNFIKYEASLVKGRIVGKGRNKMSNEWNFELKKTQNE